MDIIYKVKDKVEDKEVQIELLEELADSGSVGEEMISKAEYDKLLVELDLIKKKYEELQNKYIARFGSTDVAIPNEVEMPTEEIEEEKEVIDVKDIFENDEEKEKEE